MTRLENKYQRTANDRNEAGKQVQLQKKICDNYNLKK